MKLNSAQVRAQLAREVRAFLNATRPIDEQRARIVRLFSWLPVDERVRILESVRQIASDVMPAKLVAQVLGIHANAVTIAADRLGIKPSDLIKEGIDQLERQTPEELMEICKRVLGGQQHG